MVFDKSDYCSFCHMPGAKHEGGGELNGLSMSGKFCSRKCFDFWLQWKAALINWLSQPELLQNVEPKEQPEQP